MIKDIYILCGYNTPIFEVYIIISCNYTCETGEKEKYKTYDKEKNRCLSCNNGCYIPENFQNIQKCEKCSVERCENCYGNISYDICTSCGFFEPIYDKKNQISICN